MFDFMGLLRWLAKTLLHYRKAFGRTARRTLIKDGGAAMNFLQGWDLGASFAMETLHRPWLTPVMHFLSYLGNKDVLEVVTVTAIVCLTRFGRWRTACCLAAAGLAALAIEDRVKPWVNRS